MRKLMLTTVAILALGTSGVAFGAGNMAPATNNTTTTAAQPAAGNVDQGMNSYSAWSKGGQQWQGTVAGGYSAQDLIGRDIVDQNGDDVGEVQDLLIEGNQIQKVMVDVGGFLGMGTRTVALDISQLQPEQGDSKNLVVNMTKDQLESMPAYRETDNGWQVDNNNG